MEMEAPFDGLLTSYNVLRHSHIYRGGGGVKKRGSPDSSSPEVGISEKG